MVIIMDECTREKSITVHLVSSTPLDLISSMDTDTYPGKGLSPSQLVFALSKELSHITRLPLYVEGAFEVIEERHADYQPL